MTWMSVYRGAHGCARAMSERSRLSPCNGTEDQSAPINSANFIDAGGLGSYNTCLQILGYQAWRNRGPAPVWLWRVVCRQVIEDLRFSCRIELPQVLRLLHPANHVEPGPAISALSGDDGMRMAATTVNAHHLPAGIHDQPARCVDLIRRHQCGRHQNKCHKWQSQQSVHGQAVTPTAIR